MRFLFLTVSILLGCLNQLLAQSALLAEPPIIPIPVLYQQHTGVFQVTAKTIILSDPSVEDSVYSFFQQSLTILTKSALPIRKKGKADYIKFSINPQQITEHEGYSLAITSNTVVLVGHDKAGLFYGFQSLLQLFSQSQTIPACFIKDNPRFSYRGMHLDVSRNFFPVSFIKKYVDMLAYYKFNKFHWHLTDDQGWRIEIKKYPLLQQIAAYRNETLIGHKKELPHRFDGKKYGGYYTQNEIKEVIEYATQRHITIIPEIEMPGHAMAALSAYPQYGCTGGPYSAATFWGIFDEVYCAGNDSTFAFLQNVLDEVISLFPSTYIHVGGDECVKTKWKACPKCQKRIQTEHLKDEDELQSYFMKRIGDYVYSKGRKIIGWDEILEGGLPPDATVMCWRGIEGGIDAIRQKHNAIMTPESHVYLDYYQSLYPQEPLAAAGYTPLSKVYTYEPIPVDLSPEDAKYLIGIQGNIWTEYMPTSQQVEYMMLPRALAIAELAWSKPEKKNYPDFLRRVRVHQAILKTNDINCADVFDEIMDSVTIKTNQPPILHLSTSLPKSEIYYTLDGSNPSISSLQYKGPIEIVKSETVRAAVFFEGKQKGRVFEKEFHISKSTGKPVSFTPAPKGNYKPVTNLTAVNGIEGTARYNTGEWLGFQDTNVEVQVDLQTIQTVSDLQVNVLVYHWQRMWAPIQLVFSVSENGQSFKEVYTHTNFPINGINPVHAILQQPLKARYIRIKAINQAIIPSGEYGAGGRPWLLVDEFEVN
ncbi:glycoside hydrolase family 20 protein [Cytophagaceae bacterium DM2B3-1]|uniref:beta-N-acetylhexosaminidase n=1 Tax=Xanthocytophaga flava TaxID=3048013 RepID=A0ABT7CI58_9BACT|nr:glycoside hydrolase family 20 protein [Xanthocytophaga flavus]MDJ1492354.1 glycoside hydrolase family 20 protein [Xanthocytophaga flavus]